MVVFHMQYDAPLVMEAGDSVYFDAATPHAVIAVGNGEATILTIVSLTGHGHSEGKILHPDATDTKEDTSLLPSPTTSTISEERRIWKECVLTCKYRWYHDY